VLTIGCGGGNRAGPHRGFLLKTASPMAAAVCLNEDQFLVEPGPGRVRGSSPEGVNFVVRFYGSTAAANAALARTSHRFGARFGTAVVDFTGNPPPHPGGAPRVLKHIDLVTIRHCVLRLSSAPTAG
jgi:hypothetical protein